MSGVAESLENLVKILCEHQNWAILTTGMTDTRIKFRLIGFLYPEIWQYSLENRSEKPPIGHDRPRILRKPSDAQRLAVASVGKLLGAVIDQRDKVCLARAPRADEERMMRTRRLPQLFDTLHECLEDWLAHHEQALQQVLWHGRGSETRDRDGVHQRSHTLFLRAQMYWSAGYRQRTDRPRRSR